MNIWSSIKNRINPPKQEASTAYNGATRGRRAIGYSNYDFGPETAVSSDLGTLRMRSRDAHRNSEYVTKANRALTTNEIGSGIKPRSLHSSLETRMMINELWKSSSKEFDPEGILNVYGQQSLISKSRNISGECFIRRRRRSAGYGLNVPVQFQILESDFVPTDKNENLPNGNRIRSGVEFNKRGKRVAYYMYKSHPSENSAGIDNGLLRIPASQVIHHFVPTRPGQVRGEPISVQSLMTSRTLDEYSDAELERKREKSKYTGFIKRTEAKYDASGRLMDPLTGSVIEDDGEAIPIRGGSIISGLPGEELTMFDSDKVSDGYEQYMRQQLIRIAAGFNVPYELMTGDWAKVNDRLVRAILNEFRRFIEELQDLYMIHQVCEKMWSWWMDAAIFSGALTLPGYADNRDEYQRHEWRAQGWAYIHPEQDINAKSNAIASGLTSHEIEVAKSGGDANDIMDQNIKYQTRLAEQRRQNKLTENEVA